MQRSLFIAPLFPLLQPQLQLAVDSHSLAFTAVASVYCMTWFMSRVPPVALDHPVVLERLAATPARPWLATAREGHGWPPCVARSEKLR
eukprot:5426179-Pyramimonas_sp.AAC.1